MKPARKPPPPDRPKLIVRVLPSEGVADVLRDPCRPVLACRCACVCNAPGGMCSCSPCAACQAEPRELEPMRGDDSDSEDPTSAWGKP